MRRLGFMMAYWAGCLDGDVEGEEIAADVVLTAEQATAPRKPDFDVIAIASAGCTGTGGDPTIRVTVKNRGARTSGAWVDVFRDRTFAPPIGTLSAIFRASGSLAPLQTLDIYFALPGATPGVHRVDVLMDTTRTHDEIDENDNHGYANVDLLDCSFN